MTIQSRFGQLPPLVSGVIAVARQNSVPLEPGTYASSLADFDLQFDRLDLVARAFALRGFFEWRIAAIAATVLKKGDVVFEGGAQLGTETFVYCSYVGATGTVVSFEADQALATRLKGEASRLGFEQSVVEPKALAAAPGFAMFETAENPDENWGVGSLAPEGAAEAGRTRVELATLDDAMAVHGGPALLVMDIQGGELGALQGAERVLSEARPIVVLEVESESLIRLGGSAEELVELLRRHRYRFWRISRMALHEVDNLRPEELGDWLVLPEERVDVELPRIKSALRRGALLPPSSSKAPWAAARA